VSARRLLWWLALIALAAAAAISYSPRLAKHALPTAFVGLGLFVLGWLSTGTID
jgi:hypothetical protein